MKIGLFPPFANPLCTPEHIAAVGRAADERGFSSLWVAEHVVLFEEYSSRYPYLESGRFPAAPDRGLTEPFATIGFLAAVTSNIRLGTGVLLVPQRNPVYTAQVGDHARLAVERADGSRHRRRLAGRGVRRTRRAVRATR